MTLLNVLGAIFIDKNVLRLIKIVFPTKKWVSNVLKLFKVSLCSSGTIVEHLSHELKVKSSSLTTGIWREKNMAKKVFDLVEFSPLVFPSKTQVV